MKYMYQTFLMLSAIAATMFSGLVFSPVSAEENNGTDTMESNSTDMMMQNATLAFAEETNMTDNADDMMMQNATLAFAEETNMTDNADDMMMQNATLAFAEETNMTDNADDMMMQNATLAFAEETNMTDNADDMMMQNATLAFAEETNMTDNADDMMMQNATLAFAEETNMTDNADDMMMQNATLAFAQDMNMTENETHDMNATDDEETHTMIDEEKEHGSEKEHSKSKIVRDSVTLLLEGKTINAGSFIHLYDSTPFHIMNGHIAINVPCNDESVPEVNVMIGVAPDLTNATLDSVSALSDPGELCLYHVDLISNDDFTITDVALSNPGEDDIEFPEMSTVVLGVNEIMPGEHMEHHGESEQAAEHQETSGHQEESPEEHT